MNISYGHIALRRNWWGLMHPFRDTETPYCVENIERERGVVETQVCKLHMNEPRALPLICSRPAEHEKADLLRSAMQYL